MKFILYCLNNYAFSILKPIEDVLISKKYDYIWYVAPKIEKDFPFKNMNYTTKVKTLKAYKSDVIFAPGNEVPYFLNGLKTQIFHGLAGEKKGHFRIREYFDLYLTQGPYFTNRFNQLKSIHKNFDVIETGWPKLDVYYTNREEIDQEKSQLLDYYQAEKIVLYAPTFSPKLTSAPFLLNEIRDLAKNKNYLILLKFHPLMDKRWVDNYKMLSEEIENIRFQEENDIVKFLIISDILISDTSSVVYEFLLLDKPVITYKSIAKNIVWKNLTSYGKLTNHVLNCLEQDEHKLVRKQIIKDYHPYTDGKSALRMVEAVEEYLSSHPVPKSRKISLFRKLKTHF